MSEKEKYRTHFNDQDYYFKVTIYNGDGNFEPVELPNYHISDLVIVESLFDWNTTGHVVIRNEYEVFERSLVNIDGIRNAEDLLKPIYTFRHDGRNKINVRIYPIWDTNQSIGESREPETWEINFDFVVYDVEDIQSQDLGKKFKKLYFWDERYQHFLERNIQWSTYYVAAEKLRTKKPLVYPICKVADAIKHLIQTACGENDLNKLNDDPLQVGDPEGESTALKSPSMKVASFYDEEKWDDKCEKNKIFYTSPAAFNVYNDLEYLTQQYVSSTEAEGEEGLGSPGFLRLHRYTKKWSLQGFNKLFEKAGTSAPGEDLVEHFYIEQPDDLNPADGISKTPTSDRTGTTIDVHSPASMLLSYKFVGAASKDDLNTTNRPVIQFENFKNFWSIFRPQDTAEKVKDIYKRDYLPNVMTADSSGALISLNKDKLNGLNTMPEHTILQTEYIKILTRNEMILNNIILNQACELTTYGLTCRTPGKFISIDRKNNLSKADNDFEDKLIGQWLLTNVTHKFTGLTYYANVAGVKMHSFKELTTFIPENDTYRE